MVGKSSVVVSDVERTLPINSDAHPGHVADNRVRLSEARMLVHAAF